MRRLVLYAWIALLAVASGASAGNLKAGVARIDLTPPLELKATLGGYGARMSKPAVGVHDRVFAKALVLSEGSNRFALVTADVLGFPPGFKDAVLGALRDAGWKDGQLMLLASHSHTSIDMSALYTKNIFGIPQIGSFHKEVFDRTVARLAQVVTEAGKDLAEVRVATASVALPGWNRNRRRGSTACDPELTVTRIDKASGEPLAVLVNWSAHPTFMGPKDMMFSGDYPGHLQRTVEALIGRGVTVMFYNGAQGDQSPVARPDSGGNWEKAERYGRELGIRAWREWEKVRPAPATSIASSIQEIPLPPRAWHHSYKETGGREYGVTDALAAGMLALLFPAKTHSISLRLGDLVIVGIPGEMTATLGLALKSKVRASTGAAHVTIGGLADEWISYILSAEEYRAGGYEASVSFYGETLGQVISDGALRAASRLGPSNKTPLSRPRERGRG